MRSASRPGSRASAQWRAIKLLALLFDVPLLAAASRRSSAAPRIDASASVAGIPTFEARPGHGDSWPAVVFLNGVTARGRFHPVVERLALGLARIGFSVLVPDPPGLARGELGLGTLAGALEVAMAAADRPETREARVALVGVSTGAMLALCVAEEAGVAERVSVVAGVGPFLDLTDGARLATTGHRLVEGELVERRAPPLLSLVAARSLLAGLAPGPARDGLLGGLGLVSDDDPDPLAPVRRLRLAGLDAGLDADLGAVVELLANTRPDRFDALWAALPLALRSGLERLSPIAGAERLRAPVELIAAPDDQYLPLSEARAFALAARRAPVRLTVSSTLNHAVPSLSALNLVGLGRFDGWAVRVLRAASGTNRT